MDDHESQSGFDLDVWGGHATRTSYVPRPRTEDPCIVKVDGVCTCPPGFERCEEFGEMTTTHQADTEGAEP